MPHQRVLACHRHQRRLHGQTSRRLRLRQTVRARTKQSTRHPTWLVIRASIDSSSTAAKTPVVTLSQKHLSRASTCASTCAQFTIPSTAIPLVMRSATCPEDRRQGIAGQKATRKERIIVLPLWQVKAAVRHFYNEIIGDG